MPALILIDRNQPGQRYPLEKARLRIGRRPDNDILVSNMMVSAHHAEVRQEAESFVLTDLGSTNGTFVNGVRLNESRPIGHNDQISIGGVEFIFQANDNVPVNIVEKTRNGVEAPVSQVANLDYKDFDSTHFSDLFKSVRQLVISESPDRPAIVRNITELEKMFQILDDQLKQSERFQQRLHTLYEVGKIINLILEEDQLLQTIIDLALKVMNADCGFIMLYDPSGELVPRISRKMEADEFSASSATFSLTIARQVAESGTSILTSDAQTDDRFRQGRSIISNQIRSVICAPLRNKNQKILGVLYVGSNLTTMLFSQNDVEMLEAFANHAAISLENAKLYEERRRRAHLKSALERYVSRQIAERIISNDESGEIRFPPEKREITVLFSDIRGFTSLAERLSPERMVEILNRYFTRMIDIIFRYGGTLDKFMGDSVMALFGAPESSGNDAVAAVEAAVEMQKTIVAFNLEQDQLGLPRIEVGIGINTGPVIVGNIGSDQRMEYSAIGDEVNVASRLQGIAKGRQILMSKATQEKLPAAIPSERLDAVLVKGKSIPVDVYQVLYESPPN